MLPNSVSYTAKEKGASLLVLGSIHGKEKCGAYAAQRIINEIENKDICLDKGSVSFVPICNPKAYEANQRYIDTNLNRIIKHHSLPSLYEEHLANVLVPFIQEHDFILDLHSQDTTSPPVAFLDYRDQESIDFSKSLGIKTTVTGWPELFLPDKDYSTGACAHRAQKTSVTIECGSHDDPHSVEVAYTTIKKALFYLKITQKENQTLLKSQTEFLHLSSKIIKESDGYFTKEWTSLDKIKKGERLAVYNNGKEVFSPFNGVIFMPDRHTKIGDEWFYLGQYA